MGLEPNRIGLGTQQKKEEKRLVGQQEIDGFGFYRQCEFSNRRLHQSAINTHHGMFCRKHFNLFGTIRVYTLVIEELTSQKQIDTFEKLRHFGMIDHRNIQLAVVGNGVRRLAIPQRVAHAHRHYLTLNDIGINLEMHFIIQSLED